MKLPIIIIAILAAPAIGLADTIHVPGDYGTIQEAIDASVNGDTVLVAPGTYVENLFYHGKAITVRSRYGPANTTIDGNQSGSVVAFMLSEHEDSVLDGFTITNGSGTWIGTSLFLSGSGGGIYCSGYYSGPTIVNNIICNNKLERREPFKKTYADGAGIFVGGGASLIANNVIFNNICDAEDGNWGGGLALLDSDSILINNTVFQNEAEKGGGMYCSDCFPLTVVNSIFWSNAGVTGPEIKIGNGYDPATLDIAHSDVKGGKASVHLEPNCTLNWGAGMIDAAPLFVDESKGDLHIQYASPCRDTGDNSNPALPEQDFEGDTRTAYGTADMGADEFHTHLYHIGSTTPGAHVELKLVGTPNAAPVILFVGSGVLDPPIHHKKYGDWYLQFPLTAQIGLGAIPPPDGVKVLPFTIPMGTPVPLELPLQAAIEEKLTNLCLMQIE